MSKERELLARVAFETVHNNGISEKLYGEIEAYLAEPAQEPEPVAWIEQYMLDCLIKYPSSRWMFHVIGKQFADNTIPLFATPTPPAPALELARLGRLQFLRTVSR